MIQKASAMGNWWLAASSQHRACSCILSCAEFFGETSNHPGDSGPLQPRFDALDFWLFPKLKSPLKGKRFQTIDEIQENTMGQLMAIERTVWGPKVPTFEQDWGIIVPCTMFLICSSINVSISHIAWLDIFWTNPWNLVRRLTLSTLTIHTKENNVKWWIC